ncbi:unnamed protein product [Spirodela intermedia]|uniref:Myb/SANT-like DNA-binding domain-containing protein n=1 Tax=Spirodela intermedia TaxID=51605 RepID=A0A7I8KGS5_SPIIN|nr:unnamed protein product [Spirodela intermedia]
MAEGGGGGGRPPRLPRWTRQEILVLIQGKKVAESRGRGRAQQQRHQQGSSSSSTAAGAALVGAGQPVEPKWATVSAYCRRHGVSRGPVQCRKRWSNLASDYKKIKEWEARRRSESGGESFWVMRNDLRRERKLPGFFDKEVYDILDGTTEGGEPVEEQEEEEEEEPGDSLRREVPEAAVAPAAAAEPDPGAVAGDAEEPATGVAAVFDSGRTAAEDALFSDFEQERDEEGDEDRDDDRPAAAPTTSASPIRGAGEDKEAQEDVQKDPSSSQEGRKRKRPPAGEALEEDSLPDQLIQILERNSRALMTHVEAQNVNHRLDREQRKEHGDSLVVVLSKVADALGRIADKL